MRISIPNCFKYDSSRSRSAMSSGYSSPIDALMESVKSSPLNSTEGSSGNSALRLRCQRTERRSKMIKATACFFDNMPRLVTKERLILLRCNRTISATSFCWSKLKPAKFECSRIYAECFCKPLELIFKPISWVSAAY